MKQFHRKRKMLLFMPFLVIPFLTLAFYASGGGKGKKKITTSNELKLTLPSSPLPADPIMDKLGFYDKAKKDSIQLDEWMRNDPNFKIIDSTFEENELARLTKITASKYNQRLNLSPDSYPGNKPEDEVLMKLQLLQHELEKKTEPNQKTTQPGGRLTTNTAELERMMETMKSPQEEDTEIKQLSTVMDKILDIQHPSRVKERDKEKLKLEAAQAFTVRHHDVGDSSSYGFYSISSRYEDAQSVNANLAVVHENQILVSGSIIKLRLVNAIYIDHEKIPAGNFVFGIVTLNGERLDINIHSIRSGNAVFPVALEVYDMDGIAGIHIPGAITRDVAKQNADNSLQLIEPGTLDPSFKAQATTAGIGTLRNLLGKKVKMIKVIVKAGYRVLLKNKVHQ